MLLCYSRFLTHTIALQVSAEKDYLMAKANDNTTTKQAQLQAAIDNEAMIKAATQEPNEAQQETEKIMAVIANPIELLRNKKKVALQAEIDELKALMVDPEAIDQAREDLELAESNYNTAKQAYDALKASNRDAEVYLNQLTADMGKLNAPISVQSAPTGSRQRTDSTQLLSKLPSTFKRGDMKQALANVKGCDVDMVSDNSVSGMIYKLAHGERPVIQPTNNSGEYSKV